MKLTLLLTKIAASLFIAAKAVKGQQCDGMPDSIANLPSYFSEIKQTWCNLVVSDPTGAEATLFAIMVAAAIDADPSGAFFSTCLQDVIDGMRAQVEDNELAAQGVEREGDLFTRYQCDDTKTKVLTVSTVTVENGMIVDDVTCSDDYCQAANPWNLIFCKSASCDTDTLNQVLNSIALQYYAFGPNPYDEGTIISNTITPSVECWRKQIVRPIVRPEEYCSGESAPVHCSGESALVCSNKKLIEVKLGTDAPFELAVCDDNDCLASVGNDVQPLKMWVDGEFSSPFCMPVKDRMNQIVPVEMTILEKEFNLSDYCSPAAVSGRTGRCEPPTDAPVIPPTVSPVVVTKAPVRMTSAPVPAQVPVPAPLPAVSAPKKRKKSKKGKSREESFFN
mmetsp:Transcript_1147/g.1696  ORF Transcript_1147/g.1696 Transcript_1147/m.1696 type:complete len:392 (+) Transcript_1147:290-1465(+)